jgi:TonB family protein
VLVSLVLQACAREVDRAADPRAGVPYPLPVDARADTGAATTLAAPPRAWLARVGIATAPIAPAGGAGPPLPVPEPAAPPALEPPGLEIDDELKPPIPRARAPLIVPRTASGVVEVDVRVDEAGRVTDVEWAGGGEDSAMVAAAIACAEAMTFYPAQRAGRAVAVWCRQRFDFSPSR